MAKSPTASSNGASSSPTGTESTESTTTETTNGRASETSPRLRLEASALDALLQSIREEGFVPIGPLERSGAIVYDTVEAAHDLPRGISDEQDGGRYRLTRPGHDEYFAYAVGAHSWKRELFPAERRLFTSHRSADGGEMTFAAEPTGDVKRAFVGVRACELAAIHIQDRVFLQGAYRDSDYAARRAAIAIIVVQCTKPAGTCFCASMGSGPRVDDGFDLSLTEVAGSDGHFFLVQIGSALGARIIARVPSQAATTSDIAQAEERLTRAEASMGRSLDTAGLHDLLERSHDSTHWNAVAERCLTCTNCTMACPTCFCSSITDTPLLDGDHAERWRRWDSCFAADFSYIHGGPVRASTASRYRQWLTHKLGNWWEQFGTLGCVGCGRCITWCPVGIDLTEEIAALRTSDANTQRRQAGAEEE